MRTAQIERNTAETKIKLSLSIDGSGKTDIKTGCGFLDHMLTLFGRHAGFDLSVYCDGDTYVDYHHTVEDIGICLGKALKEALSDKRGITRYGSMILPMDETLVLAACDISGRSHLETGYELYSKRVGDFDTELVDEFFISLVRNADITLHIRKITGSNTHHVIEAMFKAVARALSQACAIDPKNADSIPSTKGVL